MVFKLTPATQTQPTYHVCFLANKQHNMHQRNGNSIIKPIRCQSPGCSRTIAHHNRASVLSRDVRWRQAIAWPWHFQCTWKWHIVQRHCNRTHLHVHVHRIGYKYMHWCMTRTSVIRCMTRMCVFRCMTGTCVFRCVTASRCFMYESYVRFLVLYYD